MKNSDFVHLHVHSHYSLLDGLATPEQLIERAKELGLQALAITDHGAMYGAIEFYKAAKKAGLKPIIGAEIYISARSLKDKISKLDSNPYHLTLFAKNSGGYRNLMKIVSIAHLEGYYYRPRIDKPTLKKYAKGLIAASACLAGEIPRHIVSRDEESARRAISEYIDIFGQDDFYLELQDHPELPDQAVVNKKLKELAKEFKLELIATSDVHYARKEDKEAHDVLVCVQTGKTVEDPTRMIYEGDYSLQDPKQIMAAFKDVPEAIANTKKIAQKCDLEIKFEESLLPQYPLPKGKTENDYLRDLCEKGIKERFPKASQEELKAIHERLDYELKTIFHMGFASYFLIVADFVNWAKKQSILVGPGRGSAAGSLVSYLINITDIDPIAYGLLFERFLNPDRIEMPDIDMDFADHRRAEVLQYVAKEYGEERVAGIITFGTMAARAAIRDVGRALGMPYADVDAIAKVVPPPVQGKHIPLEKTVKEQIELKEIYERDPKAKRLLQMAMKLEGTVRHASQHASAFVITRDELTNYVPLQTAQKEGIKQITQYSMYPVAELGLLKMDFLGLSNLTTIERALEIIEAVHGDKIDIHNLPLNDKKTFQLLAKAETTGVFQLESSGMKRYIKELKPTTLDDIAIMVALYRPGPLQFIDTFIRRKNGKENVSFPHPMTENALKVTYGIPVYQEQVMQIAKDMAGFTGGEADTLRKAMGKKIAKLMAEMKFKFIGGAIKQGVPEKKAEEVFAMLEDFAAYGFNKSHAVSYAMIAYQTAYLKAHFPECFMAALLTSDLDDIDRIGIEIEECERLGLEVLPPDINESFVDFGVVKESGNIRFGLGAIKNIGTNPAKIIVRERKKNGPYKSFEDFIDRMSKTDVEGAPGRTILNKKILEALAKSGAIDSLVERSQALGGMEIILKRIQGNSKQIKTSQIGLFGEVLAADIELGKLELPQVEPASKAERLSWEKQLLGIYLSEHPLREVGEALKAVSTHQLGQLDEVGEGHKVKIAGLVSSLKKINTRSGQPMIFAGLEDLTGKTEVLVFPKLLESTLELWQPDTLVIVEGKISTKDNEIKVLADKAEKFEPDKIDREHLVTVGTDEDTIVEIDLSAPTPRPEGSEVGVPTTSVGKEPEADTLTDELNSATSDGKLILEKEDKYYVVLPKSVNKDQLLELKEILAGYEGNLPLILAHKKDGEYRFVKTKVKVEPKNKLEKEIEKVLKQ